MRYGNVIYSRGSVIPLFVKQIINNQKITITNPNMTRFLISLDDAINLVVALNKSKNGDIFIKKSPAATISQLAICLRQLFKSNQENKLIGIRHGEKVYETLATKNELLFSENSKDYFKIKIDNRSLNYETYFEKGFSKKLSEDYTSHNTNRLDDKELKKILLRIPEINNFINK